MVIEETPVFTDTRIRARAHTHTHIQKITHVDTQTRANDRWTEIVNEKKLIQPKNRNEAVSYGYGSNEKIRQTNKQKTFVATRDNPEWLIGANKWKKKITVIAWGIEQSDNYNAYV